MSTKYTNSDDQTVHSHAVDLGGKGPTMATSISLAVQVFSGDFARKLITSVQNEVRRSLRHGSEAGLSRGKVYGSRYVALWGRINTSFTSF